MLEAVAVFDVGKSHTKLSFVDADGRLVASRSRPNAVQHQGELRVLDTEGIEKWFFGALRDFAARFSIVAIIPVAHGATAALVADGRLVAPVLDYELDAPEELLRVYSALRGSFEETFSPALPHCLNLGLQLFWQESLYPGLWPSQADMLLWPQYWAWRLCGELASEVTSLGCHTDLWRPYENSISSLAVSRGWNLRFPPRRHASAVVGSLRNDLISPTGLHPGCKILCGIHDSNASLLAARGVRTITGKRFAVVSTGTWFVALQSGQAGRPVLDPLRDTLSNVDVDGVPTPSARFMGGREFEAIAGEPIAGEAAMEDVVALVARGVRTQPSFVEGSGPFPESAGGILGTVDGTRERLALASLHAALMTNACLNLIAAEGPVLVDGRFSANPAYLAALASLRHPAPVFRSGFGDGVALGAARLFWSDLPLPEAERITPLPIAVDTYSRRWLQDALARR